MAKNFSDKVPRIYKVKVNKLVVNIFKRKVAARARVLMDPIPRKRIKEFASTYEVQDPHHLLSAKTDTPLPSVPAPLR